jgi:TIR domain
MAHDVFISYATAQKALAFQLTQQFEADGVRCWIAPRDIQAGKPWVDAIMGAIRSSRLMLVLLSDQAINSPYVEREVGEAAEARVTMLPVRLENLELPDRLLFFLRATHWYDAFDQPTARRYGDLIVNVKSLLAGEKIADPAESGMSPVPSADPAHDDATGAVDLESLRVEVDAEAEPPPAEHVGQYDVPMNSDLPGCLILLVDQSGSMNRRIAGTTIPKREAVADAVNGVLLEAVMQATGDKGVLHRFDIGVLGYGVGDEGVYSVFGKALAPINEIAEAAKPAQRRVVLRPDGQGGTVEEVVELPPWLDPVAKGKTKMYEAFEHALAAAKKWTSSHPDSFPPIIINITDGGYTEKDPTPLVIEIQELCTRAATFPKPKAGS